MLKKLLAAVLFCCTLLIPLGGNAYYYPKYLNNDSNIELAWGNGGTGLYVDKSSVVCEYYEPPYYRLAANVIEYDNDKHTVYRTYTQYVDYHTDTGAIYVSFNGRLDGPYYNRSSNSDSQERVVNMTKIIWKTAYNMNWKW